VKTPRRIHSTKATDATPLGVAIDTGGTFTDCVWIEGGEVRLKKVFSTPDDPSRGILEALKQAGVISTSFVLLHGTTVGTNALLERKGARVAFITTAGFEDTIQIGRQARPKLYDFFFDTIQPLVPSELRFGIEERTTDEGDILRRPENNELQKLARQVKQHQPESIAISLLFSFVSPENEQAVAGILRKVLPGIPLSISHLILPEFREYERASTVVVNAYLQPLMQSYLQQVSTRLCGHQKPEVHKSQSIFVMQSSGGITSLTSAIREPVRTVLSGPAGGVVGAAAMAQLSGFRRIITFDMGGTSTDVSLVDDEPHPTSESEIVGLPVRVPMLDVQTVGAGGGSLARFDQGGALRVGPESAGADPGPICYGRGVQPTVTDANLLLGRLSSEGFLGGAFKLDFERTRKMVERWLRTHRSSLSTIEFAEGVIRIANAAMEKAIRMVSIERGYDPRDFTLVAFGGAGGIHACDLADAVGIPRVLIPKSPGALSAYGILVSDVVKDFSRTVLWPISSNFPLQDLEREFEDLELQARAAYRNEHWTGKLTLERSLDMRYRGQGYELNVPFRTNYPAAFHTEHRRRYGYSRPQAKIELVTLRLRAKLKPRPVQQRTMEVRAVRRKVQPQIRSAVFDGRKISVCVWQRSDLRRERRYRGPAIITEYSATTVIPPRFVCYCDRYGNLVAERGRPDV